MGAPQQLWVRVDLLREIPQSMRIRFGEFLSVAEFRLLEQPRVEEARWAPIQGWRQFRRPAGPDCVWL
jgi:hypothetical protein